MQSKHHLPRVCASSAASTARGSFNAGSDEETAVAVVVVVVVVVEVVVVVVGKSISASFVSELNTLTNESTALTVRRHANVNS